MPLHERAAWIDHVLNSEPDDFQAYLRDVFQQMERGEPRGLSNRSGFRRRLHPPSDYVSVLEWDNLAQTPQGQAATAIYNQALTVQGPHGPLATQAGQRTARSPGAVETAYWSPDGGIGAIRNGEPGATR